MNKEPAPKLKFSEILQLVLENTANYPHLFYICLNIKSWHIHADFDTKLKLVEWIESHLGNGPHTIQRGVIGWLYNQCYITVDEMMKTEDERFYHYRIMWLKDMIAYWKEVESYREQYVVGYGG